MIDVDVIAVFLSLSVFPLIIDVLSARNKEIEMIIGSCLCVGVVFMVKFAFTLFSCSIMFIMCKGTETICAAKS
jgi:hypothetical protein